MPLLSWWALSLAVAQDVCAVGCPHATVQAAVDSVPAGGSGSFTVAGETFAEAVQIDDRTITLQATLLGAQPVFGPGADDTPVFRVTGGGLTLRDVALDADFVRGIDAEDAEISLVGAAVFGRGLAGNGATVRVRGGSLTITLSNLTDGTSSGTGGLVYASDADVTLSLSNFADGAAVRGGCVAVQATEAHSVTVSDVVFRDCSAAGDGGGMWLTGPLAVTAETVSMRGGSAPRGGGMFAEDADVTLTLGDLSDNDAFAGGGAIHSRATTLSATTTTLDDNVAGDGGALYVAADSDVTLTDVIVADNEAFESGGGVFVRSGTLTTTDVAYTSNRAPAGRGGGLFLGDDAALGQQVRATFCRNSASFGGGVYSLTEGLGVWSNARFLDNTAQLEGGGLAQAGPGTMVFSWANFLGNSAGQGSGAAMLVAGGVQLEDVLVGWSIGATAIVAREGGEIDRGTTAWFANDQGNMADLPPNDPDAIFADPLLDRYAPSGSCEVVQDWPVAGSPLRSAGREGVEDLDGTPADIGAYGGPLAPRDVWLIDEDGDGWTRINDCDDGDPSVYPGQSDPPYDGLDADCDRGNDFDADRDGFVSIDWGGTDCDDSAADTYPGAPEDPEVPRDMNCDGVLDADLDGVPRDQDCDDGDPATYPGAPDDDGPVDRDCNGSADGQRVFQLTACQTGPGPAGVAWVVVVALALRRRQVAVGRPRSLPPR